MSKKEQFLELWERAAAIKGMMDELSYKIRYLKIRVEEDPDSFDESDIEALLDQYQGDSHRYVQEWEEVQKEILEYDLL